MADIIGAMAREREYLSYRMKGEEPYHFADAVKEYGFESIKDYSDAKRDYEFSQLKFGVVETTPDKAIEEVFLAIKNRETKVGFLDKDFTLVESGNLDDADKEYCNECGVPIYPISTGGGTIVSTAGDLGIGICIPSELSIDTGYILSKLADILRK